MRKKCILGLMVILLVFCITGCDGDDNPEIYTVTIGILTNGSITANPTSGIEGTEITLTLNPENLYKIKTGTLKYGEILINETTLKFILPAENVTVTAEFHSFFIGNWTYDGDDIWTLYDNIYTYQYPIGSFIEKGIWHTENPNIFIYTPTHGNVVTDNPDELTPLNSTPSYFTYEILSENSFKLVNTKDNEFIYIQQ